MEATSPSAAAFAALDILCERATEAFPRFVAERFHTETERVQLRVDVSLLPANTKLDGAAPRALNDVDGRFAGLLFDCCYWGFYAYRHRHLFVRNDVLVPTCEDGPRRLAANPDFARTFLHELFHAQLTQSGLKSRLLRDDDLADERVAQGYVRWLGLSDRTESSAENARDLLACREAPR